MIKASATYYALLICLIFGVLCTSVVMIGGLNKSFILQQNQKNSAIQVCENGIQYGLANFDLLNPLPSEFEILDRKINLKRVKWGLFDVLESESVFKNKKIARYALVGQEKMDTTTAIYLSNKNSKLALCGNTKIVGNCYLPKKGVDRGYISGHNFNGRSLINGKKLKSEKTLPKIKSELLSRLKNIPLGNNIEVDEGFIASKDSIRNSFGEETLLIRVSNFSTENKIILGNIILYSKDSIFISKDSKIEDIIVIAPIIYIEKGFKGNLQLVANKRIKIQDQVQLKYPSSICLLEQVPEKNKPHWIKIGENATIVGGIFAISQKPDYRNEILILIEEESLIVGDLISFGKSEIRGSVYGSVYTNSFFLDTKSSKYENYLLDAEINCKRLPENFVGINVFSTETNNYKIIKWLN